MTDLFATTNPDDEMGARLMAALRWHRDHGPRHPDLAYYVDPDPDAERPTYSRSHQRATATRPRTYRINGDGYDNHGQRVETWEHDGRVEVMW